MDNELRTAIGAIVCVTSIGLSAAQTTTPQNPAQASTAGNQVVIGCVSRSEQSATPVKDAAAAGTTFIITDKRATPPLKYRLDGDADQLRLHVGHTLEIAGRVTPGPNASGGATASASMPTLKVQSLTYISTTCSK